MRWFLLIIHSLCITMYVARGQLSLSKHGCPDKCGNVTIPYPFGIGSDCSFNSSFTVICNNDTHPPKPTLSSIGLEALEFLLDSNRVRVMDAVSTLNCSSEEKTMTLGKSIAGSHFTFSRDFNSLVVVGCESEIWGMDLRTNTSFGGCRPVCGNASSGCNGINCCPTTIPPRFREIQISYRTSERGNGTAGVCGLVFIAEDEWLFSQMHSKPVDQMASQYVPVMLEWQFIEVSGQSFQGVTCNTWTYNYSATLDNGNIYPITTTQCRCDHGYEGNPYLPGRGCQDINECSSDASNNCTAGTTCINSIGSFTCHQDDNGDMKSTIVGISSGAGVLLVLTGAWMSSKFIRKRIKENRRKTFFKRNGGLLLQRQLSSSDGGIENIKLFRSKELAQATDRYNENRILGRGAQGMVYKGMLPDGRIVAVKKSKAVDEADIGVFINEIVILSQINHRNIVKLLGCCLETEVPLLVYEFIPNGTLFRRIHDQNNEFPLSWKMRVRIATEVAGALSYLHNAATVPIYHRDIKSTNILLDDKYRAKISDFGTSRSIDIDQTHLTTRVIGTFGYLDPEYYQSSQFTEKSDVYSFGVVMVELLTGEKAISRVRAEVGTSLATHFLDSMEENKLFDILDPEILEEGRTEEIMAVAEVARRCLNLNGKKRPTMKAVAAGLVGIQEMKEGVVSPTNLEEMDFQSIGIPEDYDILSTSEITVTADTTESSLLFGNP